MPQPSDRPFRADRYAIATARDGRAVTLIAMSVASAARLGPAVARIGPWAHYQLSAARMTRVLEPAPGDSHRFELLCGGESAGAVTLVEPWLLGPYLRILAILPPFQNLGLGACVLDWFEAEARRADARQTWLCVTGVNTNAQRFYRAHGYDLAATVPDLLRDGDDELLMRKRLV
jgi:GNAT superfamily N-acetyltransferase